jgi:hypothetical protein
VAEESEEMDFPRDYQMKLTREAALQEYGKLSKNRQIKQKMSSKFSNSSVGFGQPNFKKGGYHKSRTQNMQNIGESRINLVNLRKLLYLFYEFDFFNPMVLLI